MPYGFTGILFTFKVRTSARNIFVEQHFVKALWDTLAAQRFIVAPSVQRGNPRLEAREERRRISFDSP